MDTQALRNTATRDLLIYLYTHGEVHRSQIMEGLKQYSPTLIARTLTQLVIENKVIPVLPTSANLLDTKFFLNRRASEPSPENTFNGLRNRRHAEPPHAATR